MRSPSYPPRRLPDLMSDDASNSSYPLLIAPVVQSQIPSVLLETATPQVRFLLEAMSAQSQKTDWLVHVALDTNQQVRITNGKVKKARADIDDIRTARAATFAALKGGWAVLAAIVGGLMGVATLLVELFRN